MSKASVILLLILALFEWGCSGGSSVQKDSAVSEVLEPADQAPPESNTLPSPRLEKVLQLLAGLGYQGVGLEHEDEASLIFMETVFSSPKVRNRKIQLVYTGLKLSYDKEQQSLTLGEDNDPIKALRFIEKNVPSR